MFLGAFERDETLRHFLRHGGRETLLSYPIDPHDYARMTLEELREAMPVLPGGRYRVPAGDGRPGAIGDYVFVHAGIRPGVPLDEQVTGRHALDSRRIHCRSQPARFRRGAWPHHRRRA
jgi:serine/threonine protein phosphatase 1